MKKFTRILITTLFFILFGVVGITLLTSRVSVFGIRSYIVQTGSMEPQIGVGSIIFSAPSIYAKGDIITFTRGDKSITHRIIDEKNNQFIVKGDANKVADPIPVDKRDILGKDILIVPYVGKVVEYLKTVPGFIIFVALPMLIYVAFEIRVIKKEFEKEVEKRVLKNINSAEQT